MTQCNHDGVFIAQKNFKNDLVRLISGPFDNFIAKGKSIDKNHCIWILIKLMGQETRTLVEADQLNLLTN